MTFLDELIRQVTISQAERGLLLLRVRDELRMTLSAYQDLFVSARDYDSRETVCKESMNTQDDHKAKYDEQYITIKALEDEKYELQNHFNELEQIFREKRESDLKQHSENFQFLKRVNNALKVILRLIFSITALLMKGFGMELLTDYFLLATN
jgi:dynein light intermediate chain